MSTKPKYNPQELVKFSGYIKRYYHHLNVSPDLNNQQAYNKVEDEYFAAFRVNRYSTYESFRTVKNRYISELRNSK